MKILIGMKALKEVKDPTSTMLYAVGLLIGVVAWFTLICKTRAKKRVAHVSPYLKVCRRALTKVKLIYLFDS